MEGLRTVDDNIDRLAGIIHCNQTIEPEGPVLLLGAGCSISSGCPSTAELLTVHGKPYDSFDDLFEQFGDRYLEKFRDQFYRATPSGGYWFLTELIKQGFFKLILTTNFDACLERVFGELMTYDDYQVLVRGDIDDDRIVDILKDSPPAIKLVKLHGYYLSRNMLAKGNTLWNLAPRLKGFIREAVGRRGLIVIGYSMQESRIISIFNDRNGLPRYSDHNHLWFVNRSKPEGATKRVLKEASFSEKNYVWGHAGEFDAFFSELAFCLGRKSFSDTETDLLKEDFKEKFRKIENFSKIEIDRKNLKEYTRDLFVKISNDQDEFTKDQVAEHWAKNLVFIHDPDMPGGTEVLKVVRKEWPNLIKGRHLYRITIEGRKENEKGKGKRKASEPELIDPQHHPKTDQSDQAIRNRFILVDSVSFSGNTIRLCGEKLRDTFGENIQIGVAVIFSSPVLEKMVYNSRPHEEGWPPETTAAKPDRFSFCVDRFYRYQLLYTHQILFPWGLTSSTEDILPTDSERAQLEELDKYIPHKRFSFMHRPWGNMLSIIENKNVSVKILNLKPREMTSRHRHYYRDEIFLVLDEHMIFQIWNDYILLRRGSTIRVPAGTVHRLIGLDTPCRILEIAENYTSQVEDIDRIEDKYVEHNRCRKKGDC